jgi:dihydrofolate synthase/folylpolyglutamate synthase
MEAYSEILDWMYAQLPMYQRVGSAALKKDLSRTKALSEYFNQPETKFKSIHIAGTNGKGSVSHMLASVLQEAGFKVGLYTSPHLVDFRERIRINGKMIEKSQVINFIDRGKTYFEQIQPSFFEMTVAMAFEIFAKEKVDWAIVETGLGGRLDSTNILSPDLTIITHIAMDHANMLGDTLALIAGEKAGIIKENTPIVIGRFQEEIHQVFVNKAEAMNATLRLSNGDSKDYQTDLRGSFQRENIATVIEALSCLKNELQLTELQIRAGLKKVVQNTGLMGRFQQISNTPKVICDIAHNEAAIKNLLNELEVLSYGKLKFVFGVVNDKDIKKVLSLLPNSAEYYIAKPNIPRGLNTEVLGAEMDSLNMKYVKSLSVAKAYQAAIFDASDADLILVTGSAFVVAEVLEFDRTRVI